jgi:hypothetical protein
MDKGRITETLNDCLQIEHFMNITSGELADLCQTTSIEHVVTIRFAEPRDYLESNCLQR